ncbi:hypothetical protein KAU39_02470 [bacterium]|nr:hypothetical protein [bacterium]
MEKIIQKEILVECSADYKYPGVPKVVIIDKNIYNIEKIISRMRTPEKEIFNIRLDNGKKCKISYIAKSDKWMLEIIKEKI